MNRILRFALGLVKTVVEKARIEGDSIIVAVRPHKRERCRCPVCGAKCAPYDARAEPRRWRAQDIAQSRCYLEYRPCRVRCATHGVHVESVPWARPRSRFTSAFEDQVAWMAVHCTASAVSEAMRIEWHSVGDICRRVYDGLQAERGAGRFDGIRRIGIDETSYKKGHRYITVVVDHDRGCLIWAHEGCGKEVLNRFLDELTREQRRTIEVVTADGARWIKSLVKRRCPNARWVMDPFHVVSWMNDALDAVRCSEWQAAKRAYRQSLPARRPNPGRPPKGEETPESTKLLKARADAVKGSRHALLKGKENVTECQRKKLAELEKAGSRLFKAWELKEDLRAVLKAESAPRAEVLLAEWLRRASRCRIPEVVEVNKKVRRRRDDIIAAVDLGISNGRVEAINNKIKVTVKTGYGFRNIDNMISLLMLRCSDVKPELPGRSSRKRMEQLAGKAA